MKVPFWATREFKFLLIVVIMGFAVVSVLVLRIGPMLTARGRADLKAERPVNPRAWVPQPLPPGVPREVKFDGALDQVKDATPIDEQDAAYGQLLKALSQGNSEALLKDPKLVEYPVYSRMPAELRGTAVRVTALLAGTSTLRLQKAEGNVEWIHRIYLVDVSGTEGYVIDTIEAPPALQKRDLVSADAVFLKLGTYEGRTGPVQAPFLVGRSIRHVKERVVQDPFNIGAVVISVAVLSVLTAIGLTVRMLKKTRTISRVRA